MNKVATKPALLTTTTYKKPEIEEIIIDNLQADVKEPVIQSLKIVMPELIIVHSILSHSPEATTEHSSAPVTKDIFD